MYIYDGIFEYLHCYVLPVDVRFSYALLHFFFGKIKQSEEMKITVTVNKHW